MFTIKHAAELVGVSDSTLRAWERRYDLNFSRRTPSGYRLYDDEAVRLLRMMQQLVHHEGWAAREAAQEILRRAARSPGTADPTPFDDQALARAAGGYDVDGLAATLDHHFGSAAFEAVIDDWLLPALRELGAAWEDGRVTVSGEHLAAHAVARRLSSTYDASGHRLSTGSIVLGLPAGSRHDLGLLAFATAARRAGLATTYLGADVPVEAWVAATASPSVDAAVFSVPMPQDAAELSRAVEAIRQRRPDLVIAVGGSAQDLAPSTCLRLGHHLGQAAALLASVVSPPSTD